jgi:hypothetical protein
LFYIYESVRKQFPDEWIGLNFLDIPLAQADLLEGYSHRGKPDALWFDSLPSTDLSLPAWTRSLGGIAFKYKNANPNDEELARQCEQAIKYVDVATTSGDETGKPPTVEKLQKIKTLLRGETPLALASGVSKDNVVSFLPFVDIFLVASSITLCDPAFGGQEYLVPEKVADLAYLIHHTT